MARARRRVACAFNAVAAAIGVADASPSLTYGAVAVEVDGTVAVAGARARRAPMVRGAPLAHTARGVRGAAGHARQRCTDARRRLRADERRPVCCAVGVAATGRQGSANSAGGKFARRHTLVFGLGAIIGRAALSRCEIAFGPSRGARAHGGAASTTSALEYDLAAACTQGGYRHEQKKGRRHAQQDSRWPASPRAA